MEHFIKLTVAPEDAADLAKPFYQTVKRHIASGLLSTVANGDMQVHMTKKVSDGKVIFTVPLTRDLLESEVTRVLEAFETQYGGDYSIASSRMETGMPDRLEIEVDQAPLIELATAWAKQQHNDWMEDKVEQGWRYGVDVSTDNKTHPLIRQWSDLPAEYRKVDLTRIEELIAFFNHQGYVLTRKIDL